MKKNFIYRMAVMIYREIQYRQNMKKGKKIARSIIKNDKKTFFLVTSHGIGDVVWMCSYLQEYIEKNDIHDMIIITEKKMNGIISQYYKESNIVNLGHDDLILLGRYACLSNKEHDNLKAGIYPLLKRNRSMNYEYELISTIGGEMDMLYKYGCFDLPYDAKFALPISKTKAKENYIKEYGIVYKRSLILIPYANSRNFIPVQIWESIVEYYGNQGWAVYTNIKDKNEKAIKGSRGICLALEDIADVAKYAGLVITARCGLGDYLFLSQCNIIFLHSIIENPKDKMQSLNNKFALRESFGEIAKRCEVNQEILGEYRLFIREDKCRNLNEFFSYMETLILK